MRQAQALATQWLWQYNSERHNMMAFGGITPKQKSLAAYPSTQNIG